MRRPYTRSKKNPQSLVIITLLFVTIIILPISRWKQLLYYFVFINKVEFCRMIDHVSDDFAQRLPNDHTELTVTISGIWTREGIMSALYYMEIAGRNVWFVLVYVQDLFRIIYKRGKLLIMRDKVVIKYNYYLLFWYIVKNVRLFD